MRYDEAGALFWRTHQDSRLEESLPAARARERPGTLASEFRPAEINPHFCLIVDVLLNSVILEFCSYLNKTNIAHTNASGLSTHA